MLWVARHITLLPAFESSTAGVAGAKAALAREVAHREDLLATTIDLIKTLKGHTTAYFSKHSSNAFLTIYYRNRKETNKYGKLSIYLTRQFNIENKTFTLRFHFRRVSNVINTLSVEVCYTSQRVEGKTVNLAFYRRIV